MLELRFKLQKNHISKPSEERKKVKLHTCALEHAFVQNQQNPKNTLKIQKKPKKYFFSKSISNFLQSNSFDVTSTKLSNDNINYVPKQNRSSWLFVQRKFKKQKKNSKNPKAQKQQPYCYTTSFSFF
jgi:hypothetical protein